MSENNTNFYALKGEATIPFPKTPKERCFVFHITFAGIVFTFNAEGNFTINNTIVYSNPEIGEKCYEAYLIRRTPLNGSKDAAQRPV